MPDIEHVGDIKKLDGAKLAPVDIITFGSPCQDLSTAGKRAGLSGERSGLFMEAIRIIKEMREVTDGKYPRYALWENVPGALSSSNGYDFKAVLESFAETEVPFPKYGKWANAGMVRGGGTSIAWCVYNAQYFGVAQRRRRIFLVRDFGGKSAGEILFIPKSLRGYFETCQVPGQNFAAYACRGSGGEIEGLQVVCVNDQGGESLNVEKTALSPTLRSETHGNLPIIASEAIPINTQTTMRHMALGKGTGFGVGMNGDQAYTLQESHSHAVAIGIHQGQDGSITTANTAYCLTTSSGASSRNAPLMAHVHPKVTGTLCASGSGLNRPGGQCAETDLCIVTPKDIYCVGDDQAHAAVMQDKSPTITSRHQPFLSSSNEEHKQAEHNAAYSLQGNMIGRQDKNGPMGSGINEEISFTLSATDRHAVASKNCQTFGKQSHDGYSVADIASTQTERQYKSATDLVMGTETENEIKYTVRRLTPTECERLQGYPDGWTEFDHNGKSISDSKRYQMLGNSVAVPCVAYIMAGITKAMRGV